MCLVAQSCPALCDPLNCSPPGSSVPGISQARILEWVAISSLRALPDPGVEPVSPALQADSLPVEPSEKLQSGYRINVNIINCATIKGRGWLTEVRRQKWEK